MNRADKLKILLEKLSLNQSRFAAAMGMAQNSISSLINERAPISEKFIRLVQHTYNVDPSWWDDDESAPRFLNPDAPRPDALTAQERKLLDNYRSLDTHRKSELYNYSEYLRGNKLAHDNSEGKG